MKDVPYREAVGCLMYLAQSTRPHICYGVIMLSRFNTNPGEQHWNAVKHLYVKGTSKFRFVYHRSKESTIDADWESDHDERKSTA